VGRAWRLRRTAGAPDRESIRQTARAASEQVPQWIPVVTENSEAPVDPEAIGEMVADRGYHAKDVLREPEAMGARSYIAEPEPVRRRWAGRAARC